ncbi:MAG TPA: hypothetical protein VGC84_14840 [Ilumatobacteraceae bacterium]|jgi:hypothetical protein
MSTSLSARCLVFTVLAAPVLVVALSESMVGASCTTGGFPSVVVTGVVVATSVDPDRGVVATVRSDDGRNTAVVFYGRYPNNKLADGSEITVEDSWPGELPAVGASYAISGAKFEGEGGPLGVSMCAASPSVQALANTAATVVGTDSPRPPTSIAPTREPVAVSSGGGLSGAAAIAVMTGVVLGVGAVVALVRRRTPRDVGRQP